MKPSLYKIIIAGVVLIIGFVFLVIYISLQPSKSVRQLFTEPSAFFTFRGTADNGSNVPDPETPGNETPTSTPDMVDTYIPAIEQAFDRAVAGFSVRADGSVRLVQASDGFVYDISRADEGWGATQRTLSTFSNIGESFVFGADDQHIAIRFLDDSQRIQTFVGTLDQEEERSTACLASFETELKRGDRGAEVEHLQRFLNEINETVTKVDGSFGSGTQKKLEEFQAAYDIPVTGILDETTRFVINAECTEMRDLAFRLESQPRTLIGNVFPQNILSFMPYDAKNKVAYVLRTQNSIELVEAEVDGKKPRRLLTSPFTEWRVLGASDDLYLETKPTGLAPGFVYEVTSKGLQKVFGDTFGFRSLPSPDGAQWLIQDTINNSSRLILNDLRGKSVDTGLGTLVDKCVWAGSGSRVYCAVPQELPAATYPDGWYQGLVEFEDSLWTYNIATQSANIVSFMEEYATLDARNLALSPDGEWIYFINDRDSTLWRVNIPGTYR